MSRGLATVSLDRTALRSLAATSDEAGVLSIYVTVEPHDRSEPGTSLPWELRLRHGLDRVRGQVRQRGPRELWRAVEARLDGLRPELERLVDPAVTGQGRALFAPVSDGSGAAVRTVSLQVPLGDRVVRDRRAQLRPLVAAWSTAGPAGAVSVSADGVRAVDLRFGLTEVLETIEYQRPVEQRELKGPAAANPALARRSASQHDLYERREDDKLLRFLRGVGSRLAELAEQREWGYLALTGEATLVQAVRDGLTGRLAAEVVSLDHPVNSMPPPKLAAAVTPALSAARQRDHRGLADRARACALSAGNGTCGLGDTLGALREGRVAHLLLAADRQWAGSRSPDGLLAPAGEVPPGTDPGRLAPEPHLGERMIELALDNSAEVTILEPDPAAPLANADGIGALLRW